MLQKLKKVSIKDLLGFFKFILVLIPALFYRFYLKLKKKRILLVCERENMARDNGYAFYRYLKNKHPEIPSYYAIDYTSRDYEKVKKLGNTIRWSSLKHYYLYIAATYNISSHKEGNPNQTLFTVLHLYLNLFNNRVFLQHGVLYEDLEMFHYKNTKFKKFICGAKIEYDFIKEKYGYPDQNVVHTGLARFDYLYDADVDDQIIAFIPSWRRWIDTREKFEVSEYYKRINSVINNKELNALLKENDKYILFYVHTSFQQYVDLFNTQSDRIKICSMDENEIQDIIKSSAMLITDYSSLFTDFVYMGKPVIFYQFDREAYYTKHFGHYPYIDFEKAGFGDIVYSENEIIKKLMECIKNDYKVAEDKINSVKSFFGLIDKENCERIYRMLID